jgi:Tol biopolymer transport system component/DNA-binding winged helix-turn-helix (wHTH) protein
MAPEVFEFGDITVDLRKVSVSRGGQPVALEPKTFDVLRYLIAHRDRLVTKEELLDAVWKDTFVTPNVLTRAIAQMRKALGDDAFEARYVETVAKRGYRFIAPVRVAEGSNGGDTDAPAEQVTHGVARARPAHRKTALAALSIAAAILVSAGAGFYAVRTRSVNAPIDDPVAHLSPRRFTTESHSYSFPSISPDGRTVAYSSDRTGSMEIYTSGFASGSKELALTSDGGHNMFAEWSPDGQWVAYHSRKKGGIWIVPSSGGTARQVVDFGSQPAWTPDGRIVFTSDAGGMAAQSVLWIVGREGGDERQLTKLGAPRGGHSKPAVSPAGDTVAFAVSQGHISTEIWRATLDGKSSTRIAIGASPHFSGDGTALYWVGRTLEGNDTLMRVGVGPGGTPIGEPQMLQTFPGNFIGDFSIARDGTSVLWLFRAVANLWSLDVPRGGMARAVPLTSDDVRNTQPRHSRGGMIAYQQFSVGRPPTTWIVHEDGKGREPLTVGLSFGVWGPQWSPDEKRLFVVAAAPDRKWSFGWLDVATRQIVPIPISADGVMSPHLSPDGREIAFHVIDEGGVINVWRQSLDGGPRTQVTFDDEAMSYPTWAPDGKSIIVEIKRGDDTHIGIVPKDGGPVEMLVTEKGQSWPSSWAPDHDRIAFAGAREGVWNVYSVSRKTKEIRRLTDFTSVEGYVRYPSWSRTRDTIVFERAEQRGSLWTVKLP